MFVIINLNFNQSNMNIYLRKNILQFLLKIIKHLYMLFYLYLQLKIEQNLKANKIILVFK